MEAQEGLWFPVTPQSKLDFPNAGYSPLVGPEARSVGGNRPAFFFFLMNRIKQKICGCLPGCKSQSCLFRCAGVHTLGPGVT